MGPVEEHLRWLRLRGLRPSTISQRRYHLARLAAHLGIDPLDADRDHLTDWQQTAIGHYTPDAMCNAIAHVAGFYRWALEHELIDSDPTSRLIRPRVPRRLPRPISEDDLAVAVVNAPARIRAWLVLAGWVGLRACEIAKLQRQDILDGATPPVIVVTEGKGGHQRVVPIGPRVLLELRAAGLPTKGYLFLRGDGRPGPNAAWRVSQIANKHLHDSGIDATLHQLRHRYGTFCYRSSHDLRLTMEMLGHAHPSTTAGYAAFDRSGAAPVVADLDLTLPGSAAVA